ncbi:MAG: TrbI/VirB10 family protein [Francisellaceae bacterium]
MILTKHLKKCRQFLAAHPRLRLFLLFFIIMLAIIMLVSFLSRPDTRSGIGNSYVSVSSGSQDGKTSQFRAQNYNKLANSQAQSQLQHALNSGQSLISNNTPNINTQNQASEAESLTPQQKRIATITQSSLYQKLVSQQNQESEHPPFSVNSNPQQIPEDANNTQNGNSSLMAQMKQQLASIDQTLAPPSPVVTVTAIAPPANARDSNTNSGGSVVAKAGDVLFAVLDTQLNSDQPGTPVMATIVGKKFKDAKLLGSFKLEGEKLVIQFTMMSLPDVDHTISITAYAIDPQTAQNAMASDVDHHYLLRYGSLFASAFLQGFGDYWNNTSNAARHGERNARSSRPG